MFPHDAHRVTITVPTIPGSSAAVPVGKRDADYYREAAADIRYQAARGELAMGRTMAEDVAKLCEAAADALEQTLRSSFVQAVTTPVREPLTTVTTVKVPAEPFDGTSVPRTVEGIVDVEVIDKFAEEVAWAHEDWFESNGVLRYIYIGEPIHGLKDLEETMVDGATPETLDFLLHIRDDVKELLAEVKASRTGRMNRGTRLDLKSILTRRNAVSLTPDYLSFNGHLDMWTLYTEDGQTIANFHDHDLEDDAKLAFLMWKAVPELVEELEDFNQNWNK